MGETSLFLLDEGMTSQHRAAPFPRRVEVNTVRELANTSLLASKQSL